jgi:membrane protease YdiL (CAAX protease family)
MVWGAYRLLSPLPVWIEEIFVKGIVFGLPVFWLVFVKEKEDFASLGIGMKNFYRSVALGLGLGVLFWTIGQLSNWLRFRELLSFHEVLPVPIEFGSFLLLAFFTAWWEELVFSGFILQRLVGVVKNELTAVGVTACMFGGLYVPALLARGTTLNQMFLQLLLLMALSFGNSILMLRTKNLIAPIMAHALWGVTIYLLV